MVKNRGQDEIMKGWIKYVSTRRKKMKGKKRHKTFHSGDIKITINFYSGLINVPNIVLNTLPHAILRTSQ